MMFRLLVGCSALLAAGPSLAADDTKINDETRKIERLIKLVEGLKEAVFVRNGTEYDAKTAAKFMRRKWEPKKDQIKTARDFIAKIAAESSTTGKPYLIRFKTGKETKSKDFLLAELKKIENDGQKHELNMP